MKDFAFITIVFFISVLLHELAHLIAYRIRGIHIKIFHYLIFTTDDQKVSIHFNLLPLGIFGLVIPDIKLDAASQPKIRNAIACSLISAPILHVLIMLVCIILFVLHHFCYFAYIAAVQFIMFMSCFLENQNVYGDIIAFIKIITNDKSADKIIQGIITSKIQRG